MKAGWVIAAALVFSTMVSARAGTDAIDAFISAELPNSAAPGLAYARIENGVITANAFGEERKGSGVAVSADTPFPIGSVTKSFTALAIMQLSEAGKLGLDDRVSQHLPAFATGPASEVTLRQLLNHTSGYSTIQGNSHHGELAAAQIGLIDYAERLADVGPKGQAGANWEYSNANYQILGAVIEQASGQSYAEYIAAQIFEPLGMTNSVVSIGARPADEAIGHRPWFGRVLPAEGGEAYPIDAPAGGIVASARDMGLYLSSWLNGEDDILSASGKAAMLKPSSPVSPSYGLGWSIDTQKGSFYHTGLVPGAETLASFHPETGRGVVVMVNANGGLGFADTWYLIGGVGARAMGEMHGDDGSRLGPQIAYLSIVLLPPLFVLFAAVSWKGRAHLRSKLMSKQGQLSLWFPLLAMAVLAWSVITILPPLFGGSIATLKLYQPDFAWCMIATAVLAPTWALFRLALAYLPKEEPQG